MSSNHSKTYTAASVPGAITGDLLHAPAWRAAQPLPVAEFREEGSGIRPRVTAFLMYDAVALYLKFAVEGEVVRCLGTEYQDPVCRDSCVEFFVQPRQQAGYYNFEFNAIGTLLLSYIEDAERLDGGFRKWKQVPAEDVSEMRVETTIQGVVDQPDASPRGWALAACIPYSVFEPFLGVVAPERGDQWRANFYKCGDDTPCPHWASWSPIGEQLNFHVPEYFGTIVFG